MRPFVLLLACAACFLHASRSPAQTVNASIVGVVVDPHRAAVPDAAVTATSDETNQARTSRTGRDGTFTVTHLLPGRYRVMVAAPGFRTVAETGLTLEAGEVRRLLVALELGAIQQQVTVVAPLPRLDTDTAAKADVIAPRFIQTLPLNGRNYADLTVLVPGAYHRVGADEQGEGFSASGARADSAGFTLDGLLNRSDRNGTAGVGLPLDAVREFEVQTSTYGAEAGRSGGAQVSVVSRAGTNRFAGSAFDYARNDAFDARDPFLPPGEAPLLRRQQGGATAGGPVLADRLFFFGSYERLHERRSVAATTTAPSAAWLQGDFRDVRGAGKDGIWGNADDTNRIVDPLTRKELATPNVIPLSMFDPAARQMLAFIPAANIPGVVDGYAASGLQQDDAHLFLGRMDATWPAGARLTARWARQSEGAFDPFPSGRNFYPGFGQSSDRRLDSAALTFTAPVWRGWLSETRAAYFDERQDTTGQQAGTDFVSQFGIAGLATGDSALWGFPSIRIDGFSEFGDRPNAPSDYRMRDVQVSQSFTHAGPRHAVHAGFDLVRSRYDERDLRNIRGDFRFRGRNTNPANSASSGFRSFADFLLGYADQTQRQVGADPAVLRGLQASWFVQDNWAIRRRLTLNLGLRYERQTPLSELHNRLANFVPTLGEVVLAGDARLPPALVRTDSDNLAPRLGFAFRPAEAGRTVVRGGAGIYYSLEPFNVTRQQLAVSYPFVQREQFSRLNNNPRSLSFANPFPSDRAAVQGVDQPLGMAVDYHRPEYYQYSLSLEREVGRDLTVEAAYVGSQGRHLGRRYNLNQPIPTGLKPDGTVATVRPYPAFADIQYQDQSINSTFNSLQLSARRRLTGGTTLLVAYTLGRASDTGSVSTGNLSNVSTTGAQKSPQDIYNMAAERGPSDFNRTHQLSAAFAWELPFGRGRRWLAGPSSLLATLAVDWQMSGIVTLLSGRPFTPQYSAGDFATQRPDLVGDPAQDIPAGLWFNPAAFSKPVATLADPTQYGNAGRNILTGPGYQDVDLALVRTVTLAGRAKLQLRVEVFNALNHANYQLPVFLLDRSDVGRVTATAGNMREWQFAVRVIF